MERPKLQGQGDEYDFTGSAIVGLLWMAPVGVAIIIITIVAIVQILGG